MRQTLRLLHTSTLQQLNTSIPQPLFQTIPMREALSLAREHCLSSWTRQQQCLLTQNQRKRSSSCIHNHVQGRASQANTRAPRCQTRDRYAQSYQCVPGNVPRNRNTLSKRKEFRPHRPRKDIFGGRRRRLKLRCPSAQPI